MADLKQALGKDVTIRPDTHLHHEQFDLMSLSDRYSRAN